MRDYLYEILKYLFDNGGKSEVEQLLSALTFDTDAANVDKEKQSIYACIIKARLPENNFINCPLFNLSPPIRHSNQRHDYDNVPIEIKITTEGVEKLKSIEELNNQRKLVEEQVTDIKPTKWYRHWGFILGIAAVIIPLLLWIIDKLCKN